MGAHPRPEDVAVITDVMQVIDTLGERGLLYGDLFSPLHDDGVLELARRMTVQVTYAAIGERDLEAVVPPVYGRYLMVISTDVDERRRAFALRHGLGHVAAGHVTDIAFLRSLEERNEWMAHEERVADLFALVDLVPWWQIGELRKGRTSWGALRQMCCRIIRQHTIDWPEARVMDRAELRLALYRADSM